jgi:hypothetical protein
MVRGWEDVPDIFAVTTTGSILHTWPVLSNNMASSWMSEVIALPSDATLTGAISVTRDNNDQVVLFAQDTSGNFWHTSTYNGSWQPWILS